MKNPDWVESNHHHRVPKEGLHRVHIVCNIRVVYAIYFLDTAIQIPRFFVHSRVPQPCYTTSCPPLLVRNNGCGNTCIIIVSDSLQKNHTLGMLVSNITDFHPYLRKRTNSTAAYIFFIHRRRQQKQHLDSNRYLWDPIT